MCDVCYEEYLEEDFFHLKCEHSLNHTLRHPQCPYCIGPILVASVLIAWQTTLELTLNLEMHLGCRV